MLSTRLNKRQFEYERQTSNTQLLETEIDQLSREYKVCIHNHAILFK